MARVVNATEIPLHVTHEKCGNVIEYFQSEVDDKSIECPVCSVDPKNPVHINVSSPLPRHVMLVNENGKRLMKLDLSLVIGDNTDINDSNVMSSAYISYTQHVCTLLNKTANKLRTSLAPEYHQKWWNV